MNKKKIEDFFFEKVLREPNPNKPASEKQIKKVTEYLKKGKWK
jgi:hypothetical protein